MKTIRTSMLLLVLISLTGMLFAGGFALSGVGSKSQSMGGNFRALADDGTAIYWNPAGLGFFGENHLLLAGTGILPSNKYEYTGANPGWIKEEVEAEKNLFLFPNLYAVKGGESRLKYGLGLFVPAGLGATWDSYKLPETMPVPTGVDSLGNPVFSPLTWKDGFPTNDLKSSIAVIDVHPTVAYQITPCLSFGMGVSLMYGKVTIVKLMPHIHADPDSSYGYYMPTLFKMEGDGYGYGANFGLLFKKDRLGVGLTGKLPSIIKLEGDANVDLYVNNVISAGMTGPLAVGPFNASTKTGGKADLKLPGDIGLGLKYDITDKWLVTADFVYTTWSEFDRVDIDLDPANLVLQAPHPANPDSMVTFASIPADRTLPTDWEDTIRFGIGTQYQLSDCLALRAGYYYDDTPIPDETMTPTFPDINEKHSLNLGAGYTMGNWSFELNYQNIMFPEREITTQTYDANMVPVNNVGIYNNIVHAFNFGIGMRF